MNRIAIVSFVFASALTAGVARAEIIKPVKDSKPDLAGMIFQRKDAVKEGEGATHGLESELRNKPQARSETSAGSL
ncbi:MAG: hypothetical protein JWQ49_3615 [Edaphobacter sp.]|jgi:hypothetical protein|nr:hypothetical protein [Edaphobacter sp.]